jgi:hypothetical protein
MAGLFPDYERYQLLSGWCDGSLDDSKVEQLDELLRADPEFRDLYLKYMDQHAVLAATLLPVRDVNLMVQRPELAENEKAGGAAERLESGVKFRDRRVRRLSQAARTWRLWVTVAMVLLLAGPIVWYLPRVRPGAAKGAPTSLAGGPPSLGLARGFAVVIQLAGAEWEPGDSLRPSEGELLAAGRLVLHSGRMTLGLLSGVTLTLEGPADLELLSLDRVHCRRGKLRTRVPRGAEGFIVTTPGSAVIDLGTEFGLNVADDGTAKLMVFKGEAEAAVLNAAGVPVRSQQVAERRAFEIDPRTGQIEQATEASPVDFAVPAVLSPKPLDLGASYRSAVLASNPWAYWRFERIDQGVVDDEMAGRPLLRAKGPVKLVGTEGHNRCFEFGPDEVEQSLAMDGLWEPPSDPGYAVELWALPGRIGHAALASLIAPGPPTEDYRHLFLIELTASDRQSLLSPGLFRFLHRWPPGDSGGDNLFSTRHYVPNRWHHLVAQRTGGRLELYVDGLATSPVSPPPASASEPCRLLLGRLKPIPRPSGRVHSRPFVGLIDELVLYNHPLSGDEIRRHYALGTANRPSSNP